MKGQATLDLFFFLNFLLVTAKTSTALRSSNRILETNIYGHRLHCGQAHSDIFPERQI